MVQWLKEKFKPMQDRTHEGHYLAEIILLQMNTLSACHISHMLLWEHNSITATILHGWLKSYTAHVRCLSLFIMWPIHVKLKSYWTSAQRNFNNCHKTRLLISLQTATKWLPKTWKVGDGLTNCVLTHQLPAGCQGNPGPPISTGLAPVHARE